MNGMLNFDGLSAGERDAIHRHAGWTVALGVLLVALGVAGIVFVGLLTLVAVLFVGWAFLFGGVFEVAHAIARRGWHGFWLDLLSGVVTAAAGLVILFHPLAGASVLTIFLGVVFLVGGLFRMVAGIATTNPYGGWFVLHGAVSVLLGIFILAGWPVSVVWVLGTLVAIDLIVNGARLVALGLAARRLSGMTRGEAGSAPPAPAV